VTKKKGASGITTLAPYVAGQWGRGNNRLPGLRSAPKLVPDDGKFFLVAVIFFVHG
jgi:hypothetical protein